MTDETTPQDSEAMPPASAGSRGKVTVSLHTDDSACAFPDSRPIRRQRFTLTDEERGAIEWAAQIAGNNVHFKECDTLRALLARTK